MAFVWERRHAHPTYVSRTGHRQFSLRTLLVLAVFAGPVIGLGGPRLHKMAMQMMEPTPPAVAVTSEPDCILYDDWLEPNKGFDMTVSE